MLSILIPVYNYDITPLVTELHKQVQLLDIPYEIYCLDDHSENIISEKNSGIASLPNTHYKISANNNGRELTRQHLSELAAFDHLLFLDADTLPVNSNFIEMYSHYFKSDYQAVFGGIQYENERPESDFVLRWLYGKRHESSSADERNKACYRSITSPNFMIEKSVFQELNSRIVGKDYGNDIYFASLMKQKQVKILHIDNEVFHLGIESNKDYLNKSENALKTYLTLLRKGNITSEDNRLISIFISLKKYKLNFTASTFYKLFGNLMKKNLLGSNPSIKLFQLYRLSYLCYIDLSST